MLLRIGGGDGRRLHRTIAILKLLVELVDLRLHATQSRQVNNVLW